MARLSYVKENNNTGRIRLGIVRGEESVSYTVDKAFYTKLGRPERGCILDDGTVSLIAEEDGKIEAKKSALSLLSYSDNNEKGLYMKLRRKGYDSATARNAVDEMVSLGYVNEERQLLRIIKSEANDKLRGPKKILPALVSKGYPIGLVRSVMRRLCDDREVDFQANAARLVNKRLGSGADPKEAKELLYKSGF